MLTEITPLILTFNEVANIERTLERLSWAEDIVVVDSGSTDGTRELLGHLPKVRVFERTFTSHAEQWNFGLSQTDIRTEWILALDADYVLSEPLIEELTLLPTKAEPAGYRACFTYCIEGAPLRGAAYPPHVVLYRRRLAHYFQDGHTQRLRLNGPIHSLQANIFHDDRKPLDQWLAAQARYMRLESDKLLTTPLDTLSPADRLRRLIVVAPVAMLFYCLFVRGNIFDGRAGILYALQRATAEAILSLYLLQRKLGARDRRHTRSD